MSIPPKILNFLSRGWEVAAELSSKDPNFRTYILIIPQAPESHYHPERWRQSQDIRPGKLMLNTSASVQGYEIRHLHHHSKYTDTDFGWDYDIVLEDLTSRVCREFVQTEEDLEKKLTQWLSDLSQLELSEEFDSSLVGSPITAMINRPNDYPHLWQDLDKSFSCRLG
jgi:hypothetical protein